MSACPECGCPTPQHSDACQHWQAQLQRGELKLMYTAHVANVVCGISPEDIIRCDGHDDDLCTGRDDCACPCADCLKAEEANKVR